MKELSIEEKAKRYDEILARAEGAKLPYYKENIMSKVKEFVDYLIPELKESEDERIRKAIGYAIGQSTHSDGTLINGVSSEEALAWLEKQGKNNMGIFEATKKKLEDNLNKALEKETPESLNEFLEKQGDQKTIKEHNACEFCEDRYGCVSPCSMKLIEEEKYTDNVEPKFHEGDWVVSPNGVYWHIDAIRDGRYQVSSDSGKSADWPLDTNIYHEFTIEDAKDGDVLLSPSTLEGDKECPFIFKEIDKNGIVRCHAALLQSESLKIDDGITNVMGYANAGYHVPATKKQRDTLMKAMTNAGYTFDFDKKELKKIEGTTAWSEEDDDNFKHLMDEIVCLGNSKNSANRLYYDKLIKFLDELKNRAQPREEWRDKDERMLDRLIAYFEKRVTFTDEDNPRYANWLKSLKDRYIWKPSDGQMKALNKVLNFAANHESPYWNDYIFGTLNNLIRQLKKLMEE